MEKISEMKKQICLTFLEAQKEGNEKLNKTANEMVVQYLKEKTNTTLSDEQVVYLWFHCFRKYKGISLAIDETEELITLYKEMEEM